MSQIQKPWINEVVYLRGLGILSVLFLHTSTKLQAMLSGTSVPWSLELASAWVTGIPAFIFASGFVMGLSSKGPSRDWKKFYIRRAQAILPAYVFFTGVYYLYFKAASKPPIEWPIRFLVNIVKGDSAAHMWFVVAIFQLYLLLPVFERLHDAAKKRRMIPHLLAGSALIQLAWTIGFPSALVALSGGSLDESIARQVSWRFFPFSLFMFIAGLTASKNREQFIGLLRFAPVTVLIPAHLILGLLLVFLPDGMTGGLPNTLARFILRLTALGIYFQWSLALASAGGSWLSRRIGQYGQYAYGVYLAHVLVEDVFLSLLEKAGMHLDLQVTWFPAIFAGTAVFTLTLVQTVAKAPGSAYLIGQTEGRDPQKARV